MSEVINFREDKKLKMDAQTTVKKMGITLSDALNLLLRKLAREQRIDIDLCSEEPSDWLLKELAEAEADIKAGRVSPMFDNTEDAIKWLDNKNRKYANRVYRKFFKTARKGTRACADITKRANKDFFAR